MIDDNHVPKISVICSQIDVAQTNVGVRSRRWIRQYDFQVSAASIESRPIICKKKNEPLNINISSKTILVKMSHYAVVHIQFRAADESERRPDVLV